MLIKQQRGVCPWYLSLLHCPVLQRPHLFMSAVKQLLEKDFNAAGHFCSGVLAIFSERHQQNRTNGNALQVRGGKMRLQG